jgi:hypothetical protein
MEGKMSDANLEARWIVLGTNGKHVTIGRNTDPSEAEVADAESALRAKGLSGWLVLMKSDYYAIQDPSLFMIRPLSNPQYSFDDAVRAFYAERKKIFA